MKTIKTLIIIFLMALVPLKIFSQQFFPLNTVLYSKNFIVIYGDDKFVFKTKRLKTDLYKDSVLIHKDVELYTPKLISFISEGSQLFLINYAGSAFRAYCLDINKGTYNKTYSLENAHIKHSEEGILYFTQWDENYHEKLVKLDLTNNTIIYSIDFNMQLKSSDLSLLSILKFRSPENILLNLGYLEAGKVYDSRYYFFNEKIMEYKSVMLNSKESLILHNHAPLVSFYSIDYSHAFFNNGVIDSKFQLYSLRLPQHLVINGCVLDKLKLQYYLVKSEVDKKNDLLDTDVVIAYEPNALKEKLMYLLYENQSINKNSLIHFSLLDLKVLKNMVYAKYNYQFNDDFLMAYFNLYSFYKSKMDSRKTKVDKYFTPTDKANLKLIEQAISNKKTQVN